MTDLIRHDFDRPTKLKGESYASQGRVTLTNFEGDSIGAIVKGTDRYHVSLDWAGPEVDFDCSCPRFADGWPCKHIWATAIVIDLKSGLRTPEPAIPVAGWKDLIRDAKRIASQKPPAAMEESVAYVAESRPASARGALGIQVLSRRGDNFRDLDVRKVADPMDRTLFALLYRGYLQERGSAPRVVVQPDELNPLIPLMARTGRFHLTDGNTVSPSVPWDDGAPWTVKLVLDDARLAGRFERDGGAIDLRAPHLVVPGFLIHDGRVARIADGVPFEWIARLRDKGPMTIPKSEVRGFVEELYALPGECPVEIPEPLRLEEVRVAPSPGVEITAERNLRDRRPSTLLAASAVFRYGEIPVAHSRPGDRIVEAGRLIRRDLEAETRWIAGLREAGFKPVPGYRAAEGVDLEIPAALLIRVVPDLIAAGWRVEADGIKYRSAGAFRLEVVSGVDWFDLKGGLEFDGKVVPFPALLAAARRGDRHVVLGDGSFGVLPEEWMRRSGLVLSAGEREGDALRFKPGQAMLLDALLAADDRAVADPGFEKARRELATFESLVPAEPPQEFRGELRPYQKIGLGWFEFLRRFRWGGCLADDMGLGKTVQALALLADRRATKKPSLVVVPRSLVFNWKSEAAVFAPELKVVEHGGLERRRDAEAAAGADVVLTTYGILRRDAPFLKDVDFDYVILDEAQAIKNSAGATAKAARLLKADHRLAMSGTPIENHLGELWSLMEFLNPGLLGAASVFRSEAGSNAESRAVLAKALRPFILRRTKAQVAPELPPRIEQTVHVDLDPAERKRYDELKEHYRKELLGGADFRRSKFHALEALLRLRQAACHGGLIDPTLRKEPGTKLEVLIERVKELAEEGHKALVFSQFTSLLAILKTHLDKEGLTYEYLDGQTRDREQRVKRFQTDASCPLFLISLKAGGLGLNLTAAGYVFLLDPWWNPASEAQAIDRAHRIGQDKRVMALRIVARDTVEERVLELQQSKRELADAILSADGGLMRGLTKEDLSLLLS